MAERLRRQFQVHLKHLAIDILVRKSVGSSPTLIILFCFWLSEDGRVLVLWKVWMRRERKEGLVEYLGSGLGGKEPLFLADVL